MSQIALTRDSIHPLLRAKGILANSIVELAGAVPIIVAILSLPGLRQSVKRIPRMSFTS